jgi:SulP family sulfate permease
MQKKLNNNFAQFIAKYFRQDFKHDLIAGLIVGLIALPLAIAFAVASGAKAEQGLYTSIIAGIVIGSLSGCRFQISGPTGAFIVILLGIVNQFGLDGLMIAGFLAGIILLIMGIFRFGTVIKFIPYPVIVGFTSGIGLIILTGQLKHIFGLSFSHQPHGFINNLELIYQSLLKGINISSLIIATVTILSFVIWKRKIKTIPPAPIALLAGIIASLIISNFFSKIFPSPVLVGSIPAGFPEFRIPNFTWEKFQLLIPSAFTIAMLGAIESLLSAVVADGMTGTKHDSNRELIAQGIGNIILPFFGGIPATGAIARTAANIRNGGRTQVASVIHGLTLLFIVILAAPLASFIPMGALAGILVMVAINMAEIPHFIRFLHAPRQDAFVMVLTFLLTIFVDLTVAVGIGIVMAAILFIQKVSNIEVKQIQDESLRSDSEGSRRLHTSIEKYPQIRLYELSGPLFFGAASQLESMIEHDHGQTLILRMKHVHSIDATAIHALELIIERVLHEKKGRVYLATLRSEVKHILSKIGLIKKIGGEHYCPDSATKAIELAKKELNQ